MILAQMVAGYSLAHILILIVVLAACCALVWIALNQFGVSIPGWVMQVFWVVVVAFVVIFAIKLVLSM